MTVTTTSQVGAGAYSDQIDHIATMTVLKGSSAAALYGSRLRMVWELL
jgi:hypothetical protein